MCALVFLLLKFSGIFEVLSEMANNSEETSIKRQKNAHATKSTQINSGKTKPKRFHEVTREVRLDLDSEKRPKSVRGLTQWIPKTENVRVAGRSIGGMVYVGSEPAINSTACPNSAAIDPGKLVSRRADDFEGEGMNYRPSYSSIDPRSRSTFLNWLSTGRSDQRYNVGYAFLYFYGLERRVLLDNAEEWERNEIIQEVRRLLDVYGANRSISAYLGKFIEVVNVIYQQEEFTPILEVDRREIPLNLLVPLGEMVANGTPLAADWVLSWYLCHSETWLRTAPRRAFAEFKEHFRYLFERKYPDGLKVRKPKANLKYEYRAASGNFSFVLKDWVVQISDIYRLSAPLKQAEEIVNVCADDLGRFSRFLGRNPDARGSMQAHALLPKHLQAIIPCPEQEQLSAWISAQMESGGLVPAKEVIQQIKGVFPEKVSKPQLKRCAAMLARVGVGMAPDSRLPLQMPQLEEPVVLFSLPDAEHADMAPTEMYKIATLKIAVIALVAGSDGLIHESERLLMQRIADEQQNISVGEQARLQAHMEWLLNVPANLARLRRQLLNATGELRGALGQLAVVTAAADGVIAPDEITVLKRVYVALGLDTDSLFSDLHELSSAPAPVTVHPRGEKVIKYSIPPPPSKKATRAVTLDLDKVASVMADTARVSKVLGEVFAENEEEGESELLETNQYDGLRGLDGPHAAMVLELIARRKWTVSALSGIATDRNLMLSGALETINEWAFERFEEALIEEYDDFEINREIAQQIRG